MTPDHQKALSDILKWRRDVRHFKADPIPEHQMERLREAMELAPSVGNARPWRVLRIKDTELLAKVRQEFEFSNDQAASSYETAEQAEYKRLKLAGLDRAPLQLAVFTETDPSEGRELGRKTMPSTLEQSTSMAIYTLWLTARAENLGVGMLSILRPERMVALFDVPESWRFTAYLCVGYPDFEDDTPLLHREGWQENTETTWQER